MKWLAVLALSLSIQGCASLGLVSPKGFDQQLAEAYGMHTAVVSATTVALNAGSISVADGVAVQGLEVNARSFLDAARGAELAGDPTAASQRLTLALAVLTQIQTYLNSKGGH